MVLVISKASIIPPFDIQQFTLKGQIALTVLEYDLPERILHTLHRNALPGPPPIDYFSGSLEHDFAWRFVYSFEYNPEIFHQLMKKNVASIIIPESLADYVEIDKSDNDPFKYLAVIVSAWSAISWGVPVKTT